MNKNYSDYIAENLDFSNDYLNYLDEGLDKSIDFSDYLAENLNYEIKRKIPKQYITKLYVLKSETYNNIMDREFNGYYLINGYHFKYEDIKKLIDLNIMIDEYNLNGRIIWNDITKILSSNIKIENIHLKRIGFRDFVKKLKIETDIIKNCGFDFSK